VDFTALSGKPAFLMMNHCSFLDALLFSSICPFAHIGSTKTFMKASLYKMPIFGYLAKQCGHFPVYFKTEEFGNFSLDKDRMGPVMEKATSLINNGGWIR
jgi:hypothetical protein